MDLVNHIVELAQEKKGKQIAIMDISKLTNIADVFVVISGDSDVHVKAITDHIDKSLKEEGVSLYHREGYQNLRWVLLDYVDIVIHIFQRESREYYGIERLWADAKIEFAMEKEYDR
jgi:ribosome-associated protein